MFLIKDLLLPPMILLTITVCALFFAKRGVMVVRVCIGLFFLLSLPIVTNLLAGFLETAPMLKTQDVEQFKPQAIVVIGAGIRTDGKEYGRPEALKLGGLLRARYAAKLAKDTGLPVLASGGRTGYSDISEAELLALVIQNEFGATVSWQERESRNTAENAKFSRDVLQKIGVNRVILVTQAYHMRRALAIFRKAGFEVLAAPTAFFKRDADQIDGYWMLPNVEALQYSYLFFYELAGMFLYALQG